MNVILTLDNADGMAFNNRRQSRDSAVNERILALAAGKKLWMTDYSAKLFGEGADVRVHADPMKKAGRGEFCFLELLPPDATDRKIEKIYVFRWNRDYPSDRKAGIDFSRFTRRVEEEFPGTSHDNITLEVYEK